MDATQKEDWSKWESLLTQKKQIYTSLLENPRPLTPKDRELLRLVKEKEEDIKERLKRKKRKIVDDLEQIKTIKRGLRGYQPSSSRIKLPRFLSKKI